MCSYTKFFLYAVHRWTSTSTYREFIKGFKGHYCWRQQHKYLVAYSLRGHSVFITTAMWVKYRFQILPNIKYEDSQSYIHTYARIHFYRQISKYVRKEAGINTKFISQFVMSCRHLARQVHDAGSSRTTNEGLFEQALENVTDDQKTRISCLSVFLTLQCVFIEYCLSHAVLFSVVISSMRWQSDNIFTNDIVHQSLRIFHASRPFKMIKNLTFRDNLPQKFYNQELPWPINWYSFTCTLNTISVGWF